MTTIPGNNYTYIGTDLANAVGYLITRTPTANSSDTLPTASDIITSFIGSDNASNNGQSFSASIFNNSSFTITLNTATGVTFTGISSDTILPQATRTYTFIQIAASTISCYIIGGAPNAPSTNSGITLNNNNILVGNASNIATGVSMSGDATIVASGTLTLATVNGGSGSTTLSSITTNSKGLVTTNTTGNLTGDVTSTGLSTTYNNVVPLNKGGTNANLTASNGGIFYSTAASAAILTGTTTANQIVLSGSSTAPAWSTATYPSTTTANQLLYSSGTNTIGGLTTGNNGVLITSAGGVPSISSTLPTTVQGNITSIGTLTSVVNTTNTNAATSSATGSIITLGGVGIAKNMWIGSAFTGANAGTDGSLINIPAFTYTSSTSNPTNVNIDTLNQITLNGTGTATNATSLYIAGPPVAGTLAITNPYALQVANGNSNFNGNVNITGTLTTDTISKIGATQTLWSNSTTANIGSSTTSGTTTVNVASSGNSNIQTSTMTTWTAAAPDATKSWTFVCYGADTFVAVSNSAGAAAGLVRTSTDGITWTSRTASSINTWSGVCFAPDINRFCAVSSNGAANTSAMFSTDRGATWTQTTTLAAGTYSSICRGTNVSGTIGNVFVATNSSGATTTTQIYTSPDGVTWTARTVGSAANYAFSSCCWSSALKLFVAVGTLAAAGAQIVTSPDGVTWTNRSSPSTQQWRSVCWSPELGLFVAVASDGTTTTQIMTSTTGASWANATSPSAQAWQSVCWSSNYKMFVAVANNGTAAQQIMYSSTGTGTWTAATSTSAIQWNCITVSDDLNRFVAVATSAVAGNGMYTTEPITYNTNLRLGTTGQSNISFNASSLIVYPVPYYYGENTVARTTVANTPLTDITIYTVPNGRYLVQVWMLNLLKTGAATTDFIIMTGSNQGTLYTFTATPVVSLVGSASAAGASTGPKFFQFAINSYSSTGIQDISYQYQSTGAAAIFTVGTLRSMVLQRIG